MLRHRSTFYFDIGSRAASFLLLYGLDTVYSITFSCEQCFCGWRSQSSMGCSMVDSSEVSLQSSGPSSTRQLSGAQILRGILSQKVTSRGSTSEAGATVVVLHSVSKKVSQTILGSAEPVPAKQHNNSGLSLTSFQRHKWLRTKLYTYTTYDTFIWQ